MFNTGTANNFLTSLKAYGVCHKDVDSSGPGNATFVHLLTYLLNDVIVKDRTRTEALKVLGFSNETHNVPKRD